MNASDLPVTDLHGLEDGVVLVCSGKPPGVAWMLEHYGWGYIRVGRHPRYFALYVSGGDRSVRYFAEVARIVSPEDEASPVKQSYLSDTVYQRGKKVVLFKAGSLARLARPVPFGSNRQFLQSIKYTTLEALRVAKTTDELALSRPPGGSLLLI